MRVDVTWVTFGEVVVDTLVKLCTQTINLGCPSTEPETMEVRL